MAETVITVQGTYDSFHRAERATVTVAVGFEGPERGAVVAGTTQGTSALVAGIAARHDPAHGPITWYATDHIRVWANRPFNDKGEQKPLVHHASTTTRAKFRDFDDLAVWVERAAGHRGVRIDGIEWALTAQTKQGAITAARTQAVEEARRKAENLRVEVNFFHAQLGQAPQGNFPWEPPAVPAPAPHACPPRAYCCSCSRRVGGGHDREDRGLNCHWASPS